MESQASHSTSQLRLRDSQGAVSLFEFVPKLTQEHILATLDTVTHISLYLSIVSFATTQSSFFLFASDMHRFSSSFTGSHYCKESNNWRAQATLNRKNIHLGYHATDEAAARAYDNWAKDFADRQLNFREPNMSLNYSPLAILVPHIRGRQKHLGS